MTGLARTRSSDSFQPFLSRVVCLGGVLLLCAPWAWAQTKTRHSATAQAEGERRGTLNLEAARTNPLELRNFLKKMPKGADLQSFERRCLRGILDPCRGGRSSVREPRISFVRKTAGAVRKGFERNKLWKRYSRRRTRL